MHAVLRIALPLAGLALGAFAVVAGLDRLSQAEQAAGRRALLARETALDRIALAPGSALACLDAGAGDAVEDACEKKVFASAQSTAAAVAYMGARLSLLADAHAAGDAGALASTRRAVRLDRYGIAAHVLAVRDGCTAAKCPAFALVDDASVLKANLKAQVFDQYVSRYAAGWNAPAPAAEKPPTVAAAPPVARAAPVDGMTPLAAVKPGEHWDFPSAASIPAVSIMNQEPPLPQGANAQAQAASAAPVANPPVPPPRPQTAAPPATTR
jgi:hypothetical protein